MLHTYFPSPVLHLIDMLLYCTTLLSYLSLSALRSPHFHYFPDNQCPEAFFFSSHALSVSSATGDE